MTAAAAGPRWPTLVLGLSLGPVVVLLLSLLAPWWWIGELAVHWAGHAMVLAIVAAAVLARVRSRWSTMIMVMTVVAGLPLIPAIHRPRAPAPEAGPTFRVAHANLYFGNPTATRLEALTQVLAANPDIICLAEAVAREDRRAFDLTRWPYQLWQSKPGATRSNDLALLSTFPILSHAVHDLDSEPYLSATLDVHGHHLHVLVLHAGSPENARQSRHRQAQLIRLAATAEALVAADPAPVLALGDFNCTTLSPAWAPLTAAGLLTPAGEPATWERHLGPAGITIDHILGRDLRIAPPTAISLPGSDHYGLSTRIQFLTESVD